MTNIRTFILKYASGSCGDAAAGLTLSLLSTDGTCLHLCPAGSVTEAVTCTSLESHVIAGLDEKRVFRIRDPVLGLSQKTVHQEEEGRSGGAAGCGQRLSAVQVRHKVYTGINLLIRLKLRWFTLLTSGSGPRFG